MYPPEKLILGTVQLGLSYGINNQDGKPDLKNAIQILDLAKTSGIRTLDTAESYGDAQKVIGQYHKTHDTKPFEIITKLAPNVPGSEIRKHVDNDLKELNVKNLDGFLFHSFESFRNNSKGVSTMLLLKEEGMINKLGVSVYGNDEFEFIIRETDIDLVQLPFNLLDNRLRRGELLQAAAKKGVEVHTRSVFLQGIFFMNLELLPKKLLPLKSYLVKLNSLIEEAGNTIQEVCLAYALAQPEINKVLIGVETLSQLKQNIEILKNIKVENNLLQVIDQIDVVPFELLSPVNWK
jgi:aryl-alcohol dehydrogenase-like predicted oxidoreductase